VAITHQKFAELHFEILEHPAYSPNFDYSLFPNLKKRLKGKLSGTEKATLDVNGWFET
jgi:hypothetical protein